MRRWIALLLFVPAFVLAQEPSEEKSAKEAAIRREFQKLDGVWNLVSKEVGGKALPPAQISGRSLSLGAEVFIQRQGTDVLTFGVNKLDPTRSPKQITMRVAAGKEKGEVNLGIYELKGDTLRICYDPIGDDRPREFKTDPKSKQVLAVYKRVTPADETIDIVGKYKSVSKDVAGMDSVGEAEILRLGDSYIVRYTQDGRVSHLGIGLRQGNRLSVSWANRGETGLSVYTIKKGPTLEGGYTKLGGIGVVNPEIMTPLEVID